MTRLPAFRAVLVACLLAPPAWAPVFSSLDAFANRLGRTPTVADLVHALRDKDARVRDLAASALEALGPDAREALPGLLEAMQDPSHDVRLSAAAALSHFGTEARPAVPAIKAMLNDPEPAVRSALTAGLARIEPDDPALVPALLQMLREQSVFTYDAFGTLGDMGPAAKGAVPTLIDYVNQGCGRAAETLGRIGPVVKDAVPALSRLLDRKGQAAQAGPAAKDEKEFQRRALVETALALWRIEQRPTVIPLLMGLLEDRGREFRDDRSCVRWMTVDALGEIGPAASAAVPLLIDALKEEGLRDRAAQALGRIGPGARAAVPALTAVLGKFGDGIDKAAAEALGKIGPAASLSVEKLAFILKPDSRDEGILLATVAASEALWRVDRQAAQAVPALARVLSVKKVGSYYGGFASKYGAAKVRRRATEVLGEIGTPAKGAVPQLTELARTDEFLTVREAARAALKRIPARADKNEEPP
jgi:HEAT repeat protein